jgi:AraC-like DNA-binding protein
MEGIKVTEQAHVNIHEWLDPESPQYNTTLRQAIFYYTARGSTDERFQACVSTPEMREAAWKYGHGSQVILDGTFGVCDKRVLLFIVMGLDENRKGVPLAFLFFSAPSGNRHTAAGYNTEIIAHLLQEWQKSMGVRNGEAFEPLVAITDTDLKERGALVLVFPRIWLLICKFHIRQSWRNHRNKLLKGNSPAHIDVKNHLRRVEEQLIQTTFIGAARGIIEEEAGVLEALKMRGYAGIAEKGLKHLREYLLGYWTTDTLWRSWSDFGRQVAAKLLNCPIEGVLPTTNHLESFNGLLKRKHLRRWQHGGRRLRLDVLLKLLVTKVLPSIFQERAMERKDVQIWEAQIRRLPGGDALLEQRGLPKATAPTIAYLTYDEGRNAAAAEIIQNNQINSVPDFDDKRLTFKCFSSTTLDFEANSQTYTVHLGLDCTASCECHDFRKRGGACKHIRAALLRVEALRTRGVSIPAINLPRSAEDARTIHTHQISESVSSRSCTTSLKTPISQAATTVEDMLREAEDIFVEEEAGTNEDENEDDRESIATDASDDLHETSGGFDLPSLQGSAKAGIEEQALSRVFYELEGAAPKLGELGVYLQQARLKDERDVQRATFFQQKLNLLQEQLTRLVLEYNGGSSVDDNNSASPIATAPFSPLPTPSEPRKGKRRAHDIIAPSPEKASKRHNSYNYD